MPVDRRIMCVLPQTGRTIHAVAIVEIDTPPIRVMTACGAIMDAPQLVTMNRQQVSCQKCRKHLKNGRNKDHALSE